MSNSLLPQPPWVVQQFYYLHYSVVLYKRSGVFFSLPAAGMWSHWALQTRSSGAVFRQSVLGWDAAHHLNEGDLSVASAHRAPDEFQVLHKGCALLPFGRYWINFPVGSLTTVAGLPRSSQWSIFLVYFATISTERSYQLQQRTETHGFFRVPPSSFY